VCTDIDVVLHCHSIYATTLACHHKTITSFHYMIGVAGGTTIRCAKYMTFGSQALPDHAIEALEGRLACLLGQPGQMLLGKTLESALWLAIEVEILSGMYVQALTLGKPPILPDDEMGRVIEQMRKMRYGQALDAEGVNDIAVRERLSGYSRGGLYGKLWLQRRKLPMRDAIHGSFSQNAAIFL